MVRVNPAYRLAACTSIRTKAAPQYPHRHARLHRGKSRAASEGGQRAQSISARLRPFSLAEYKWASARRNSCTSLPSARSTCAPHRQRHAAPAGIALMGNPQGVHCCTRLAPSRHGQPPNSGESAPQTPRRRNGPQRHPGPARRHWPSPPPPSVPPQWPEQSSPARCP